MLQEVDFLSIGLISYFVQVFHLLEIEQEVFLIFLSSPQLLLKGLHFLLVGLLASDQLVFQFGRLLSLVLGLYFPVVVPKLVIRLDGLIVIPLSLGDQSLQLLQKPLSFGYYSRLILLKLIINLAELVPDTPDDCADARISLFGLILEYGLSLAHEFNEPIHP